MAVEFDEGHALVDEAAVPGRPADALAGKVDAAHGGGEQAAQALLGRRVLPVHERQVDARRTFHGRGIAQAPVHHVVVEHFRGRMLVRGDDVGDVDLVHLVVGGEIGQQGQLVGIALHDHEGHAQTHGPVQTGALAVELHDMFLDQRQLAVAADLRIAAVVQGVDGQPEHVQTGIQQLGRAPGIQQGPVAQQLHAFAQRGGRAHHLHDVRVGQGLAHAAEKDGLHAVGHGRHGLAEGLRPHVADDLVLPAVAETHLAAQIAARCGFYVELFQTVIGRHGLLLLCAGREGGRRLGDGPSDIAQSGQKVDAARSGTRMLFLLAHAAAGGPMSWGGAPQPCHRRTAGTRRAPQHARPLWGQRLSLLSGRGHPVSFVRVGEVCGAAGVASRQLLGLCHGAGRGGKNGHHPSGMAGERHSCLAAEAKPCKSHDGGGGTAPCRGEKGGCHARCT